MLIEFRPVLPALLTMAVLRCRVSWSTEPVSQFLILTKRGHLEGLPLWVFLVGDWRPDGGGWKTPGTRSELVSKAQEKAPATQDCVWVDACA